jgi:hypothetical protein
MSRSRGSTAAALRRRRAMVTHSARSCDLKPANRSQPRRLTPLSSFRYHAAGRLAGPRRPADRLFVHRK